MALRTIKLERDTPVRLHGMQITILAGERIEVGPRQDGGFTCWPASARNGGGATFAAFCVAEQYLQPADIRDALDTATGQGRR